MKMKERILKSLIYISTIVTVGVLLWIIGYILVKGVAHISWGFLSTDQTSDYNGILPIIISTLYLVFLGVVVATPIGVFAAIYLTEYAKQGRIVKVIRFATESLGAIPSIVFGLFGLIFFVVILRLQRSLVAGALTVTIMVLPTIIRATEEALKSVPREYREGSFALGASKFRTIFKVILPSAIPGILSATILTIGRIVGESAAVFLTAGMVPRMPRGIFDPGRTLSVHMYILASEGISFDEAYATAVVLVAIVLMVNFTANKVVNLLKRGRMAS
ncbi:phosphate ABC transporter permease PstA [Fusibacter paucivorans]|nr:phosphate ABC transporter permease PstA [Fusibacter paucivorans]